MLFPTLITRPLYAVIIALFLTACVEENADSGAVDRVSQAEGFQTKAHNVTDLSALKMDRNIRPAYHSCHTAISPEGYVFEGHIPGHDS